MSKENNQKGLIREAISALANEHRADQERLGAINADLQSLMAERQRIDKRIQELETERNAVARLSDRNREKPKAVQLSPIRFSHPASPHIIDYLQSRNADSQSRGIHRNELDEQFVNKVDGVRTTQAVSHGIIELVRTGKAYHEVDQFGSGAIGKVWLLKG
jgi:uncharacterized protein YdcH (DUF465 family)